MRHIIYCIIYRPANALLDRLPEPRRTRWARRFAFFFLTREGRACGFESFNAYMDACERLSKA